ncbi:MAG: hypothetical protein NVSMB32_13080 [Actinomycetota bacterium]
MGLFRKGGGGERSAAPVAAQSSIPNYGFNEPADIKAPRAGGDIPRTTSYPAEMGGHAKFTGRARTTSYQQSAVYNRRTYDTVN